MDSPKANLFIAIAILIGIGGGFAPTALSSQDSAQPVTVTGFLTAEAGQTVAGHDIMLRSIMRNTRYVTTSSPDGEFVLEEVLPGDDYQLDVTPSAMLQRYSREPLPISSDTAPLHIALKTLATTTLTGTVVNQSGATVADFRIKVRSKTRARWERHVTTDSAGQFEIAEVPVGEIAISSLLNRVMQADGFHVTAGAKQALKLVVDAGTEEVGGLVSDQDNAPIPGATIMLSWEHTAGNTRSTGYHRTFSHPDGRFSFRHIGPGEHELVVASSSGAASKQIVDIRGGYTDLTIVLEQQRLD